MPADRQLTRNAAMCLACGEVLESTHRHHYVTCGCPQQTMVDGGLAYARRGGVNLDLIEDLCEYDTIAPTEERLPPDGSLAKRSSTYTTGAGQRLVNVHSADKCVGSHCVIHNPSEHSMRQFPTFWRYDRGFMERTCTHGGGHPDPDDQCAEPIHACDGCCDSVVAP